RRVLLVLALLGLAMYVNSLQNAFILDDNILIVTDARVTGQQYDKLLTTQYWPPPRGNDLYRPLTSVSFALNWAVAPYACAFRFVNLALYVGCAFVLYKLVLEWSRAPAAALVAAVVWIVHPIHTYSMNTVVDRAELLACLFGLLTL